MTAETERPNAIEDAHHASGFGRCPRCSMQLRHDEVDVHLAHAHNIGPAVKKDKGKDRRNKRRVFDDE